MNDEANNLRRRRWWQFGLRGLLLLVLVAGLCLFVYRELVIQYRRQNETVALVETLGGRCETVRVYRYWLLDELFGEARDVTLVTLGNCNDPDAYLSHIAELPTIKYLVVGGLAFADQHAQRLHRLRTLRVLVLDGTTVSDEGVAALRRALTDTEIQVLCR